MIVQAGVPRQDGGLVGDEVTFVVYFEGWNKANKNVNIYRTFLLVSRDALVEKRIYLLITTAKRLNFRFVALYKKFKIQKKLFDLLDLLV